MTQFQISNPTTIRLLESGLKKKDLYKLIKVLQIKVHL